MGVSERARVAAAGEGISPEELQLAARNHSLPLEALSFDVDVVEARQDKPITTLRTWVTRGDGTVVLEGTAVCYTMALTRAEDP